MTEDDAPPAKSAQTNQEAPAAEPLIHLDTSFLISALVPGTREDLRLRRWIQQGTVVSISSVAWAELLCGPVSEEDQQRVRKVIGIPLPLVDAEAVQAAELFNTGGRRRGTLPDCLIAATALKAEATLATGNPGDFRRFKHVGLEVISG